MPTYTAQAKVIGHKIAATILKESFFLEKKLTVRIMVDSNILNPKPPRQPNNKKEWSRLLLISGSTLAMKPYRKKLVTNTQSVVIR